MCRIERYNLKFPGGRTEQRYNTINCPFGTPNNPCRNREEVLLPYDRDATEEDIAEDARRNALLIQPRPYSSYSSSLSEPRHSQDSGLAKRKSHKGVLSGLALEFKIPNPFSSRKRKEERKMARQPTHQQETRVDRVEPMERAPTPPPAFSSPPVSPRIIKISPQETEITEIRPKKHRRKSEKKHRRRKNPPVIYQEPLDSEDYSSDDSDDSDEDSPPSPVRKHQLPSSESPSPRAKAKAEAEKEAREQRERDNRNKDAERDARRRAERDHQDELRRDRRRRDQQRSQRNSPETAGARQDHHAGETPAQAHARHQQLAEDSQILRAGRYQEAQLAVPPRRVLEIHQHRRNTSYEDSGDSFIEGAVRSARQRRESSNTSNDGSHSSSSNRGHGRNRHGGSH